MYFIVTERLNSAGEEQDGLYIHKADNVEAVVDLWRSKFELDDGEEIYETNQGNCYSFEGAKEIGESDFEVLKKYLPTL